MLQAVFLVRLQAESLSGLLLKPSIPHGGVTGEDCCCHLILYFCSLCVRVCMCICVYIQPVFSMSRMAIVNSSCSVNLWIHYWDEFSERLLCTKCFTKCDGEKNINERLYLAKHIPTGKTCMYIKFIAQHSQGLWIHMAPEVLLARGWT